MDPCSSRAVCIDGCVGRSKICQPKVSLSTENGPFLWERNEPLTNCRKWVKRMLDIRDLRYWGCRRLQSKSICWIRKRENRHKCGQATAGSYSNFMLEPRVLTSIRDKRYGEEGKASSFCELGYFCTFINPLTGSCLLGIERVSRCQPYAMMCLFEKSFALVWKHNLSPETWAASKKNGKRLSQNLAFQVVSLSRQAIRREGMKIFFLRLRIFE